MDVRVKFSHNKCTDQIDGDLLYTLPPSQYFREHSIVVPRPWRRPNARLGRVVPKVLTPNGSLFQASILAPQHLQDA